MKPQCRLECLERLGDEDGIWVWKRINALFNWLPLAALIEQKILCMHGGIGRCIHRIDQIDELKRPITMEEVCAVPVVFGGHASTHTQASPRSHMRAHPHICFPVVFFSRFYGHQSCNDCPLNVSHPQLHAHPHATHTQWPHTHRAAVC